MNRPNRPSRTSMSTRRGRLAIVAAVAGLALVLASCGKDDTGSSDTTSASQTQTGNGEVAKDGGPTSTSGGSTPGKADGVRAVPAATVEEPIVLIPRPGDPGHLYLAERPGRIRRLTVEDGGRTLANAGKTLLDITELTTTDAERGLLGMAFSKDGRTIYVSYTNTDGDSRIVEYAMRGNEIDADSAKTILKQQQPFPNHNGGNILLGPDGKLWFGFGDGGAGDDPSNNAQDPETLLGKIIRFDPGEKPEIVISGVRNPWRFAFDTDGSLWIGDVGQDHYEEVDHLPADAIDGANLGWSGHEGKHANIQDADRQGKDPIPPILDYSHDGGNCSITGGFVYRGKDVPVLEGAYLFADYCKGDLRALRIDDQGRFTRELDLHIHVDSPISFGTDQAGEAYVLSQTGTIFRLTAA